MCPGSADVSAQRTVSRSKQRRSRLGLLPGALVVGRLRPCFRLGELGGAPCGHGLGVSVGLRVFLRAVFCFVRGYLIPMFSNLSNLSHLPPHRS